MDEYIKKQDAIDLIMSEPADAHYPSWYADLVSKIPTADVALVVRCKDCTHLHGAICVVCGLLPRKPNDFYSYGEKRDGGIESD